MTEQSRQPPGVHENSHAVEKLFEPGTRVGAGVDADDPFGAEPGDQSGHGGAGPERDDDVVKAR